MHRRARTLAPHAGVLPATEGHPVRAVARHLADQLKALGLTSWPSRTRFALWRADRVFLIEKGQVRDHGTAAELEGRGAPSATSGWALRASPRPAPGYTVKSTPWASGSWPEKLIVFVARRM